jgi:lysozyme
MIVRQCTENAIELIKHFEGLYLKPYICPAGFKTIGVGHVMLRGENFDKITEDQALDLLRKDLLLSERSVCRLIRVPLTNGQYDALVSFTFNLGGGTLQRSTLRMKVNREEHQDVPTEFRKWVYAGGRKLKGLILRRNTETMLYEQD